MSPLAEIRSCDRAITPFERNLKRGTDLKSNTDADSLLEELYASGVSCKTISGLAFSRIPKGVDEVIYNYFSIKEVISFAKTGRYPRTSISNSNSTWIHIAKTLGLKGTFPTTDTRMHVVKRVETTISLLRECFPTIFKQMKKDLSLWAQLQAIRQIPAWSIIHQEITLDKSYEGWPRISDSATKQEKVEHVDKILYAIFDLSIEFLKCKLTFPIYLLYLNECSETAFLAFLNIFVKERCFGDFHQKVDILLKLSRKDLPQSLQLMIESNTSNDFLCFWYSHKNTYLSVIEKLLLKSSEDPNFIPILRWYTERFPMIKLNDESIARIKGHEKFNPECLMLVKGRELSYKELKHFESLPEID